MKGSYTFFVPGRIDSTLVLMTPDNQMKEGREEVQRNRATTSTRLAILMDQKQIKPILLFARLVECHLVLLEHSIESLVGNIPHSIQRQTAGTFFKQNGFDFDIVNTANQQKQIELLLNTSEIVD